jgi:hypothetical protein
VEIWQDPPNLQYSPSICCSDSFVELGPSISEVDPGVDLEAVSAERGIGKTGLCHGTGVFPEKSWTADNNGDSGLVRLVENMIFLHESTGPTVQ